MRRGRIRIRNKMGFQIVTILIFTIILPSIFFFWFIVQRYSNDLLSAAISERENLLEAINKSISLHFDNVQELSMTVYYDTSTKNYIDGHAYEEPSAAVEEALVTILNSRQSAESMALCFGGETYVYGKSFTNLQRYREQYEQQVLEREGKCVWLPTNVMQGSFARKPKDYALARAINAPDGQVGVFYMFLSSDHLWKILTNPLLTEGSSHYYLLAPDGRIVMSDLDALTGTDMQLDFTLAQLDGQSGHLLITGEGGRRQVATYARMESTGWVSVILADRDELYSNAISLMRLARSFTVFYLMVLIAGNLAIYAFIIKPLGRLSESMEHVSQGVFQEIQIPPGGNEIRQLTESYNDMLTQIQTLLVKVRAEETAKNEQRIKVLYMQIGPHFLYNTLNSIKWMAVLNNQPGIKQMVESLMKLLGAVAYNKEDEISLREELELLESYIFIQKVRFMNFRVEYDVPEQVLSMKIGRFMLQPFVENCIIHGLHGLDYEGVIRIRIRQTTILQIDIWDNGRGMKTDALTVPRKEATKDSVGIQNVAERIRLHYGERYGVHVENNPDRGVHVHIELPVIKGEEER